MKKKTPSHNKAYAAVPMTQDEEATMDNDITIESGMPVSKNHPKARGRGTVLFVSVAALIIAFMSFLYLPP
jgi:hypothetical protein